MNKNHLVGNLRFVLAIFTLLRLARLLAIDDGPLWVFARLHDWTDHQSKLEQDRILDEVYGSKTSVKDFSTDECLYRNRYRRYWASLDDGLRCPFCVGIWLAPLVGLLYARQGWLSDALLVIIGLAGGQALLQGVVKE